MAVQTDFARMAGQWFVDASSASHWTALRDRFLILCKEAALGSAQVTEMNNMLEIIGTVLDEAASAIAPPTELLLSVIKTVPTFDAVFLQQGRVHLKLCGMLWKKLALAVSKHQELLRGQHWLQPLTDFALARLEKAVADVQTPLNESGRHSGFKLARFMTSRMVDLCTAGEHRGEKSEVLSHEQAARVWVKVWKLTAKPAEYALDVGQCEQLRCTALAGVGAWVRAACKHDGVAGACHFLQKLGNSAENADIEETAAARVVMLAHALPIVGETCTHQDATSPLHSGYIQAVLELLRYSDPALLLADNQSFGDRKISTLCYIADGLGRFTVQLLRFASAMQRNRLFDLLTLSLLVQNSAAGAVGDLPRQHPLCKELSARIWCHVVAAACGPVAAPLSHEIDPRTLLPDASIQVSVWLARAAMVASRTALLRRLRRAAASNSNCASTAFASYDDAADLPAVQALARACLVMPPKLLGAVLTDGLVPEGAQKEGTGSRCVLRVAIVGDETEAGQASWGAEATVAGCVLGALPAALFRGIENAHAIGSRSVAAGIDVCKSLVRSAFPVPGPDGCSGVAMAAPLRPLVVEGLHSALSATHFFSGLTRDQGCRPAVKTALDVVKRAAAWSSGCGADLASSCAVPRATNVTRSVALCRVLRDAVAIIDAAAAGTQLAELPLEFNDAQRLCGDLVMVLKFADAMGDIDIKNGYRDSIRSAMVAELAQLAAAIGPIVSSLKPKSLASPAKLNELCVALMRRAAAREGSHALSWEAEIAVLLAMERLAQNGIGMEDLNAIIPDSLRSSFVQFIAAECNDNEITKGSAISERSGLRGTEFVSIGKPTNDVIGKKRPREDPHDGVCAVVCADLKEAVRRAVSTLAAANGNGRSLLKRGIRECHEELGLVL